MTLKMYKGKKSKVQRIRINIPMLTCDIYQFVAELCPSRLTL